MTFPSFCVCVCVCARVRVLLAWQPEHVVCFTGDLGTQGETHPRILTQSASKVPICAAGGGQTSDLSAQGREQKGQAPQQCCRGLAQSGDAPSRVALPSQT